MDKLYKPIEVAEKLNVSIHTINKWLQEGKLKGVKVGNLWRVTETDLERFVKTE